MNVAFSVRLRANETKSYEVNLHSKSVREIKGNTASLRSCAEACQRLLGRGFLCNAPAEERQCAWIGGRRACGCYNEGFFVRGRKSYHARLMCSRGLPQIKCTEYHECFLGCRRQRVARAMVRQSSPQIEGPIDAATTYRTLKSGMRCVRARYQRALKRNPGLTGEVKACLTINRRGRVTGITVDQDTVGDGALNKQIQACLRRLRFSPPQGASAKVCVPFMLYSRQ